MLLTYYRTDFILCGVSKKNEQWVDEIVCNMQLIERFDANINSVNIIATFKRSKTDD